MTSCAVGPCRRQAKLRQVYKNVYQVLAPSRTTEAFVFRNSVNGGILSLLGNPWLRFDHPTLSLTSRLRRGIRVVKKQTRLFRANSPFHGAYHDCTRAHRILPHLGGGGTPELS